MSNGECCLAIPVCPPPTAAPCPQPKLPLAGHNGRPCRPAGVCLVPILPQCCAAALAVTLLITAAPPVRAAGQPLWGYGVRGCAEFVRAAEATDGDLQRYEDWLTGFVSALNLATNEDVLRGASIDSVLARTRAFCERKPDADFFNATMDAVRSIRVLP